MDRKTIKYLLLFSIIFILCLPLTVDAVHKNTAEDTQVGTASKDIEKAIAKGKELAEVTDYWFGGGHGGVDSADYNGNPPKLDCSSFVHWMYYKGAGIDIDKGQVLATFGYKDHYGQHYKKINSEKDLKRGDLVQLNGNAHVEVYLGDGKYIGQNGNGGNPDLTGGVNITDGNWERSVFDGYKIDMEAVLNDKSIISEGKAEDLKDGEVTGKGKSDDTDDTDSKKASSFNPFSDIQGRQNTMGLSNQQGNSTSEYIDKASLIVKSQEDGFMKIVYILSYIVMIIALFIAVGYIVFPQTKIFEDIYKKLTGKDLIRDTKGRNEIIINTILVLTICGLVMAMQHTTMMYFIYEGMTSFWSLLLGLGGMSNG